MEKRIKVNLKGELEASEIARFVQVANQYKSAVYIEIDGNRRINAKSIMGMMNFLSGNESEVVVNAQGVDETMAVEALAACLTGKE